ncbi:MAG: hypothetical protein IIC49_03430 [Planctomycetes bacterium]|nr:hypothetical protein [Planctomycetota bacterium]
MKTSLSILTPILASLIASAAFAATTPAMRSLHQAALNSSAARGTLEAASVLAGSSFTGEKGVVSAPSGARFETTGLSQASFKADLKRPKEEPPRDIPGPSKKTLKTVRAVGIGAVKYADLSNDRVKDYVFSMNRMIAFEGDTGPYLLNALVRIKGIFRKGQERSLIPAAGIDSAEFLPEHPAEKTIALQLLRYPAALSATAESLGPHRLCVYLYELAGAFSKFYEQCPVLAAEGERTRASRLRLCQLTARVLADGLGVLGIPTLDRM